MVLKQSRDSHCKYIRYLQVLISNSECTSKIFGEISVLHDPPKNVISSPDYEICVVKLAIKQTNYIDVDYEIETGRLDARYREALKQDIDVNVETYYKEVDFYQNIGSRRKRLKQ